MKEFYHEHYSSNIMCLTVYGTQSLDDLETLVSGKFAAVPDSNLQPPPIAGRYAVMMHALALRQPTSDLFRKSCPYALIQPCVVVWKCITGQTYPRSVAAMYTCGV